MAVVRSVQAPVPSSARLSFHMINGLDVHLLVDWRRAGLFSNSFAEENIHSTCDQMEAFSTMGSNVIVWDIETVPDLRGFAAAHGYDSKTDDEIREALGEKFPKHIYHSNICIGALIAH